ncbi:MAG: dethiobiotin synthase [Pseudomonadota bacterium]
MKKYFITATGTDIGKTFFTAKLTRKLVKEGKKVIALKPVISGFNINEVEKSDTGILLKAQGMAINSANIEAISPFRYEQPISPDMAAEDAGEEINLQDLLDFCKNKKDCDYLIIEGAGGVMTPIGKFTVLDWIKALDFEIILVAGSYLGTISHTLTAYQTINAHNLKIHAIIINESENQPVSIDRTILTLKRFLPNNIKIEKIIRDKNNE